MSRIMLINSYNSLDLAFPALSPLPTIPTYGDYFSLVRVYVPLTITPREFATLFPHLIGEIKNRWEIHNRITKEFKTLLGVV